MHYLAYTTVAVLFLFNISESTSSPISHGFLSRGQGETTNEGPRKSSPGEVWNENRLSHGILGQRGVEYDSIENKHSPSSFHEDEREEIRDSESVGKESNGGRNHLDFASLLSRPIGLESNLWNGNPLPNDLWEVLEERRHRENGNPANFHQKMFRPAGHKLLLPQLTETMDSSYHPVNKRNPDCLRKCIKQGFLHPAQCHSLC